MRILSAKQMKEADRHAIEDVGIPSVVLMENAGGEVVRALEDRVGDLSEISVLVLCGTGNNGGDGMVVARHLHARGTHVRALLFGDPAGLSPDAEAQWRILRRVGVPHQACGAKDWPEALEDLEAADVVVDAIFGTGFRGRIDGFLAEVVEDVNACPAPVVAVDVPSGLSGDSASDDGPVIEAALTVTFAAPKLCHVFAPAHRHCGDLVVADIGIPRASLARAGSSLELVEPPLVAALVAPLADREEDTHKGTWGHVLVVGGAIGRTGAPSLAGIASLMSGAGLVTVAVPAPCVGAVAATAPELMQIPLPSTEDGESDGPPADVAALLARASVLVVGPGLGTGDGAARLLDALLEQARLPIVLDADALNLLALHGLPQPRADRPLVLTPHPGELARLVAASTAEDFDASSQLEREDPAAALAARLGAVVVVKGYTTLVITTGEATHVIPTGGPGMATAGAGDVLAGLVGGLIAQGLSPWHAAVAGTYLHGLAGDVAEQRVGQMPLRATDLLRFWPAAIGVLLSGDDDDADDAD